jgi:hypothetical protein
MIRDHELAAIGEVFSDLNQRLGDNTLGDLERDDLLTKWFLCLDSLAGIEAVSRRGMRVQAGAIVIHCARTDEIHKGLCLALVSAVLGVAK